MYSNHLLSFIEVIRQNAGSFNRHIPRNNEHIAATSIAGSCKEKHLSFKMGSDGKISFSLISIAVKQAGPALAI
jgi:hypothetical protein